MGGVIAAGHPRSAEAGARVLSEGGNAIDAAVGAALMAFAAESPLTGPGGGGFMLVRTAAGDHHLLDFFVAAPGRGAGREGPAVLDRVEIRFSETAGQHFHIGPGSCGVPGTVAGLAEALRRFGTAGLEALCAPAAAAARNGVEVTPMQAYLFEVLAPILSATPEARALYEPEGRPLRAGDRLRLPELADLLDRVGVEGAAALYSGELAGALADWVGERGGLLTREDLAAYAVVEREPARATFRGREILTNPPPSSGGILVAYALDLLSRVPDPRDPRSLVEAMRRVEAERTEEFLAGLHAEGYLERFLSAAQHRVAPDPTLTKPGAPPGPGRPPSRLGSTTHVAVLDDEGACASVTSSIGSCSGVVVPGTGVQLNNMLGEQDLNPLGFGRHEPGRRISSMMAPTVVVREGAVEVALGSAGSNRIRSAILQTVLNIAEGGCSAAAAVEHARLHLEGDVIEAEPGVDPEALADLEREGWSVRRWPDRNLFFGGVQAVARDPDTGALSGGGDPRRGGAAIVVA